MATVKTREDAGVHEVLAGTVAAQHAALQRWGMPPTRVLVLYNACAHRCFFCASEGTSDRPAHDRTPWSRIAAHLSPAMPSEQGRLVVAGNEPVLHPDWPRLLALAAAANFTDLALMTSGVGLEEPERLERWVANGLRSVVVPLYSADPAVHDDVVGGAAHAGLMVGLDAARDAGVQVHVHTLALRRTAAGLPALARLCADRWGAPLVLAPVREKPGLFDFEAEALDLVGMRALLNDWEPHVPLRLVGMPACLAPGLGRDVPLAVDLYFRSQERGFGLVCAGCGARPRCPGVVWSQLDRHGDSGLVPLSA